MHRRLFSRQVIIIAPLLLRARRRDFLFDERTALRDYSLDSAKVRQRSNTNERFHRAFYRTARISDGEYHSLYLLNVTPDYAHEATGISWLLIRRPTKNSVLRPRSSRAERLAEGGRSHCYQLTITVPNKDQGCLYTSCKLSASIASA